MSVGASQVGIVGNLSIAPAASLNGGGGLITVGGNWANSGTFTAGTSTVIFADGCTTSPAQLTGTTAFASLTFTSTGGRTFVLPPGGVTSVAGALTLSGAPGLPIQIVSAAPTQLTYFALGAGATVSSTNVQLGTNVSISCNTSAPGDCDGDGIPNAVETQEGTNPNVKDNDVFTNARLFAMQQYRDFLSREGDPAGITGWTNLITGGTYTRLQVIDAFLSSAEFSGFVAPVVRLYFATFLRVPDYSGLAFNAGLVKNGTITLTQLADFFTASPEFVALYGSLDNTQFVTLLYNNVLGRAPDTAGLNGWVGLLASGYTRGQVLLGFSDSVEYQAAMANKVFVTMMYAGMLRRTPEPTGFNGWVGFLDAATLTREEVINGFFLSTEYHNRFLP
jgi:hypothetical protein